jgi:hypothetical protein
MSAQTKREVLAKLRRAYARAGSLYKRQLLDQAVSWLGYHRKAAIRALRARPAVLRPPGLLPGRPKTYHPDTLLPILKPIWLAALQPCGLRPRALLAPRAAGPGSPSRWSGPRPASGDLERQWPYPGSIAPGVAPGAPTSRVIR